MDQEQQAELLDQTGTGFLDILERDGRGGHVTRVIPGHRNRAESAE
jgi:hypothetical protein